MTQENGKAEFVVVLDFGAQYSQLIARRIRECNVYSEILSYDTPVRRLAELKPAAIVLTGGPSSVYDEGAPTVDPSLFQLDIPILGICYGMQLMGHILGGRVVPGRRREYGRTELKIVDHGNLFKGMEPEMTTWMSHGDSVAVPPPGFVVLARTANTPVASMANLEKKQYGVQFHPEVAHTEHGKEILRRFLYDICECRGLWSISSFIEDAVTRISEQVGDGRVVLGLSGGVDSACVAALVHRAVGNQLTCIFVDNGVLRKGEKELVRDTFEKHFNMNLVCVDAERRFLSRLRGLTDPEQKRKAIGEEFIRVFEEEASKLGDVRFLAQGTIYPDVIESGTRTAARIKSHHNVGGLPSDMKFELVEPLRYLFKDEVRDVCQQLGIPDDITWRQPFPGPGLAVRCVGEVTQEKLNILREADAIVVDEIKRAGLYRTLWQSFAVLLPVQSVGVMGDARTYAYPIVLRAVTSDDVMTADWARLPHSLLERIGSRIINEVRGVNRFLYDISSKPPATVEWE